MTDSSRSNLPKSNRVNEKPKATHIQDRIHSTAEPTTSINSPKQTYAEVVNGGSSFLDLLNEMKSQIQSLLIMQRQVMQCAFPQMWSTTQNQDKQNWAHPPGQPIHAKFAHPNSVVVSQDNSCTTKNACPTYEFMLLNVAHLLLNISRDKSKIKFIVFKSHIICCFI